MSTPIDPEGKRLPIKLDSTSNGEFAPMPLWPANLETNRPHVNGCTLRVI